MTAIRRSSRNGEKRHKLAQKLTHRASAAAAGYPPWPAGPRADRPPRLVRRPSMATARPQSLPSVPLQQQCGRSYCDDAEADTAGSDDWYGADDCHYGMMASAILPGCLHPDSAASMPLEGTQTQKLPLHPLLFLPLQESWARRPLMTTAAASCQPTICH